MHSSPDQRKRLGSAVSMKPSLQLLGRTNPKKNPEHHEQAEPRLESARDMFRRSGLDQDVSRKANSTRNEE
jgi:hypothetical protein